MKFSIQRTEFIRCLSLVSEVVDRRSPSHIASNALLTVDGNELTVFATDFHVSVRTSAELVAGVDGCIGVPAKDLLDRLKTMTDATVEVSLTADKLALKSGRRNFTLRTYPGNEFPAFVEADEDATEIEVPAAVLAEAFARSAHSMNAEPEQSTFGAVVEAKGGFFRVVTSTTSMLASVEIPCEGNLERIIIGPRAVSMLRGSAERPGAEDTITLRLSGTKLWVDDGAAHVSANLLQNKFPPFDDPAFLVPKGAPSFVADREALIASVKATGLAADAKTGSISLEAADGTLTITAESQEGEASDQLDAATEEPVSFSVYDRVFAASLSACPGERVRVIRRDLDSPVFVEPVDEWHGRIRLIAMPTNPPRKGGK